jgi:MFS family permease
MGGFGWGIWMVIFNLYLLDLGFREDFIGYMFLLSGLASGLAAFPAGIISDRIGRRKSLLTGATVGSVSNMVLVFTSSPFLLLAVSLLGGLVGILSWVARAPFMMENSEPEERTHLFSISFTTFLLSNMTGSFVGGFLPKIFSSVFAVESTSVEVYRATLTVSVMSLFLALLPYYAIREKQQRERVEINIGKPSLRIVESRTVIGKLVLTAGLIGLGAGLIVPFFNVFFRNKLGATSEQIGIIFALGNISVAAGTTLAPIVSSRLGKVRTVAFTELCSIPFIYGIAFSPNLGLAAASYLARGALMNMAGPVRTNFAMEAVQKEERATTSGLTIMADGVPRAISASIAGQLMRGGNYVLPYMITSVIYFFASMLFLLFFRKMEKQSIRVKEIREKEW